MRYTIVSRPTLANPSGEPVCVLRTEDDGQVFQIPFVQSNSDARRFAGDWKGGADVKDQTDAAVAYSDGALIALGLQPAS